MCPPNPLLASQWFGDAQPLSRSLWWPERVGSRTGFAFDIARARLACGSDGTEYARTIREEWEAEEEERASIAIAVDAAQAYYCASMFAGWHIDSDGHWLEDSSGYASTGSL